MEGLGGVVPEVPHHIVRLQVVPGISLLGVNEIGELYGVSDEEDRCVIAYHVVVALFSVELNGESSRVSCRICRALLSSNSREPDNNISLFSNSVQESGFGVVSDIMGHLESPKSTCSFGMNYTFRDSFPVKFGQLVNKSKVLEQNRALRTSSHRILVIIDRAS